MNYYSLNIPQNNNKKGVFLMTAITKKTVASFYKCPIPNRKTVFQQSTCIMPISIGQKYHDGEKFLAIIKLINKSFKACTLFVADSIYRHTLKITDSSSDPILYQKAALKGQLWLDYNRHILSQLTIPHHILRWDYWLQHPDYLKWHAVISKFYGTNAVYQHALDETIVAFLTRYKQTLTDKISFNMQHAFTCCLAYLKEECAALCLMAQEQYDFEVYPTGRNPATTITHELLIKSMYPDTISIIALRFKKLGSRHLQH